MIAIILFIYLTVRIYPYLFSSVPLGYDPGLYLYLFRQYVHIPLWNYSSLPTWIREVYPPLLPFVMRLVTPLVAPEHLLVPLVLLAALALFGSVYFLTRALFDKKTALVALTLVSLSTIQYRFYWYYYVKNIFAASLLLCLIVLMRRRSRLAWIVAPAIVLLHQPTAILMFVLLVVPILFRKMSRFTVATIGFAVLAFVAYDVPNYTTTIVPFLPALMKSLLPHFLAGNFGQESGTFYTLPEAFWYLAAYLPFALATLWQRTWTQYKELVLLLFVSVVFSCGVFLSRRFIPFLDLFIIVFASISLAKMKLKFLIPYFLILSLIFLYSFPSQSKTLIMQDELDEITLLSTTEPNAYILTADNEYTPWIYGYSLRKPITPGFGEYDRYWSYEEWNQFWLSNNRETEIALLKKLPKPLYMYLGDRQRQILFKPEGECFTRFSWHVYKFVCE